MLSGPDNNVRQILGAGLENCQPPATLRCGWAAMAATIHSAPCSCSRSPIAVAVPLLHCRWMPICRPCTRSRQRMPQSIQSSRTPQLHQHRRQRGSWVAVAPAAAACWSCWHPGRAQHSAAWPACWPACRQLSSTTAGNVSLRERVAAHQQFALFWPAACKRVQRPCPPATRPMQCWRSPPPTTGACASSPRLPPRAWCARHCSASTPRPRVGAAAGQMSTRYQLGRVHLE